VQQCSACNTEVVLDATAPLPQLRSFAQWLARHAGLVSSIECRMDQDFDFFSSNICGLPREAHLTAAQGLIQLSIQAAAMQVSSAGNLSAEAPLPATEAPLSMQQEAVQQ
jgi:hypothetical protein